MEIKVKDLGVVQEKSRAEIEEQLLQKHEEKFEDAAQPTETVEKVEVETPVTEEPVTAEKENTPVSELNDTDVLSYIKDRYNKDINSVDELFAEKRQIKNYQMMCLRILSTKKKLVVVLKTFIIYKKTTVTWTKTMY